MIAYNIVCVMERVTVGDREMERIIVEGGMQSARCDHVHVDLLQTSHSLIVGLHGTDGQH